MTAINILKTYFVIGLTLFGNVLFQSNASATQRQEKPEKDLPVLRSEKDLPILTAGPTPEKENQMKEERANYAALEAYVHTCQTGGDLGTAASEAQRAYDESLKK